ncbi:NAD(P)-dependent alcohol dehydrogenase [Microbacterium keratanolyticum]
MRASVLSGPGKITVEERPTPSPASDEVLIRVLSVGVCGSDVHYFQHGRIGDFVVDAPLVLGHEASGEIVAVGSAVDPARVGERVSIEPQRPCRACEYCRSGAYNLCQRMEFYATPPVDGAFSEYVIIQDDFAYAVPDEVSDDAAALIEPLSVGIAAVQKAELAVGDTILIAGGGPIGVIIAQVARAFGASDVIVSDIDASRRELALAFGATRVVDPITESIADIAPHVFIDASGATPAIVAGIDAVRPGGRVVLVGSAGDILLSVPSIAVREVTVTGIFRYTNTWPIALALLRSGAVDLDALVTHRFGLEQVQEALSGDGAAGSLKRIVHPGVARNSQDEPTGSESARTYGPRDGAPEQERNEP